MKGKNTTWFLHCGPYYGSESRRQSSPFIYRFHSCQTELDERFIEVRISTDLEFAGVVLYRDSARLLTHQCPL